MVNIVVKCIFLCYGDIFILFSLKTRSSGKKQQQKSSWLENQRFAWPKNSSKVDWNRKSSDRFVQNGHRRTRKRRVWTPWHELRVQIFQTITFRDSQQLSIHRFGQTGTVFLFVSTRHSFLWIFRTSSKAWLSQRVSGSKRIQNQHYCIW